MLRYNLNKLLAERNLSANRVYVDTGISRSTLSKLINNQSNMIQLETIDKLCQYLKVSPSEFLAYIPLDVEVTTVVNDMTIVDWQNGYGPENFRLDLEMFIKFKDTLQNSEKSFEYHINNISKVDNNLFFKMSSDTTWDNDPFETYTNFFIELKLDEKLKTSIREVSKGDYTFSQAIEKLMINSVNAAVNKVGFKDVFATIENGF